MAAMVADGVNLELKSPGLAEASAAEMDRTGKSYTADTLAQLRELETDMFTTVFVGNSQTRELGGHMVTPRGYRL